MIAAAHSSQAVYDVPRRFKVSATRQENAYTRTLILDGALPAAPGQFVMAWLPADEDRPFSIVDDDPLTLTVAAVGPFSGKLARMEPGDSLWLRGPFGRGYQLPPAETSQSLLLAGDGYLISSLHFLAKRALQAGHDVTALFRAARASDAILLDAFEALGVEATLVVAEKAGASGFASALASNLAGEGARPAAVYASGSAELLAGVSAQCEKYDLPYQLAWKTIMKCGIGLCGTCEIGAGWLTCTDGPVFPFDPLSTSPQVNSPLSTA